MAARTPVRREERPAAALQRTWSTRSGTAASLLPLSALYGLVTGARRLGYRTGALATARLPVPVIVVGNIVTGGAGKTPAVIAIVRTLQRHGWRPGIVSRGYGRPGDALVHVVAETTAAEAGDEPVLLRRRTGVPVVVAGDRVAAGRALLDAHPRVDIVVADDGLQHLALGRDVEVIVFDDRGAGNGWLLPAGPLRQHLPTRLEAHRLVLYNAPQPSTALPGFVGRRHLGGVVSLAGWWAGEAVDAKALVGLRGRPIVAAAGLARPERFFAMLRDHGLDIAPLPLPDHHDFATVPWGADAVDVVVTEKDAVKLPVARAAGARVWVAALDFEPEPAFDAALLALLPPAPAGAVAAHGNTPS